MTPSASTGGLHVISCRGISILLLWLSLISVGGAQGIERQELIRGCSTYRDIIVRDIMALVPEFQLLCDSLAMVTGHPEYLQEIRRYGTSILKENFSDGPKLEPGKNQLQQTGLEKQQVQVIMDWFSSRQYTEFEYYTLVTNDIMEKNPPYPMLAGDLFWEEIQFYQLQQGEVLADIGTGSGFFPLVLVFAGLDVTWIITELDPILTSYVENKCEQYGRGQYPARVHFALGHEKEVDLGGLKADKIFLRETFHHLDYPDEILLSLRNQLKPGGRVFVTEEVKDFVTDRTSSCKKIIRRKKIIRAFASNGFHLMQERRCGDSIMLCYTIPSGGPETASH